jgi:hypothetical protein
LALERCRPRGARIGEVFDLFSSAEPVGKGTRIEVRRPDIHNCRLSIEAGSEDCNMTMAFTPLGVFP